MKKFIEKNYCRLYIVRHGETDWNLKKIVQGHTDTPLNKTGEKQARELAATLRRIKFSAVFSSDLIRSRRTAEIVAQEKKIAIKTTKALRERYFGKFEGRNFQADKDYQLEITQLVELSLEERRKQGIKLDIEGNEEMMRRFIPFLRELSVAYPSKNVLVVTHGGVIRILLNHLGSQLSHGSISNAAYVILDSDGVDFFIRDTFGIKPI